MLLRRLIPLAISAVAVFGCTAGPPGQSPAPQPSASASTVRSDPTGSPTSEVTPGVPFEHEIWYELFPGDPEAISYSSLDELVDASDLVVTGRAAKIERGPETPDGSGNITYSATVTFEIDEVLSGSLQTREPGAVAVRMLLGQGRDGDGIAFDERYAQALASVPNERTVLFLLNLEVWMTKFGFPDHPDADPMSYMPNGGQSWFRETDGNVTLPTERVGDWPQAYEGARFDAFLDEVRAASAK